MEDNRLKTFREVAKQGNFTRAAQELYITQPAVTSQIKSLEQELGASLFDRSGQKIALTAAGRLLLSYADSSYKLSQELLSGIASLRGEEFGEITVAASTTIAQYVLPRVCGQFAVRHQGIRFRLLNGNTEQVADLIESAQADVGLVEGGLRRKTIKAERLTVDEIVLIAPTFGEWCSAAEGIWTLDELKHTPLILRESGSGTRTVLEEALSSLGVSFDELNILMQLASTEAIKEAVEGGLGVAFVSTAALRKELLLNQVRLGRLATGPISREFRFIFRREQTLSSVVSSFIRFTRAELGSD